MKGIYLVPVPSMWRFCPKNFQTHAIIFLSVVSPRLTGNVHKGYLCILSVGNLDAPPTMSVKPPFPDISAYMVDVPAFAFHVNMLLLSLFALYVASTLPRALVRLFQPSELFIGFFLRSGAQRTTPWRSDSTRMLLRADTLGRSNTITTSKGNATGPHHSTIAHAPLSEDSDVTDDFPALVTPIANRARGIQQGYVPTRVPRWTTIVHPSLAYALNFRVSLGFSLGKLLVLLTYALIVLYACLFRSNPLKDPNREGYIAVSQIPIVVALASKSNWMSWISGVGYQKVNINKLRASPKPLF
jgi:ferric-chelate reductase